jgi:autotransporter-associated beta strand protein
MQYSAEGAIFNYTGPGGTAAAPTSGNWNVATNWTEGLPVSEPATELRFGGSGAVGYTSTHDLGEFSLNILRLNSAATVQNTIGVADASRLLFVNNGATNPTLTNIGAGSFVINPAIVLSGTGVVTFGGTGTGTVTLAGDISGAAAFTINNSRYTFANTTDNSYTGATTISGGTVTASAGAAGVGAVAINSNLTQSGGQFTYTNPNQINDFSNVTVSGGTFALGAHSDTIGNLTVSGGTVSGAGGGVLTVNQTTVSGGAISAILTGFGGIQKTGVGTATLTGANTFTGNADLRGGTLLVQGAAGSIGLGTQVILGFDLPGTLTLNNATDNNADRVVNGALVEFNRAGGTLNLLGNAAGTTEVVGAVNVAGIGTISLTGTSGGAVQLTADSLSRSNGAIDFRGAGGTLGSAGGNPRVVFATSPVAAAGDFIGGWATVNGADFATHDPVTGIKAFTAYTPLPASGLSATTVYSAGGNVTLTQSGSVLGLKLANGGTQTVNLGANTLTVEGGGGIVSGGTGVTTINGTGALTFINEGVITVGQGTVVVNAPIDAPVLIKPGAGRLTVGLSSTNAAAWMSGGGAFSGELELRATADQVFTGAFSGSGTLVKTGPAKVTLTNAESSFTNFRVDQGVLEALAEVGNVEFNNTTQTNHLGANNTGAVTINGGTLKLTTGSNSGTAGNLQLNRGVTFTALGGTLDLTNQFGGTLGGGNTVMDGISIGGGSGGVALTTSNASNAAAAVIKWNGGQYGLSILTNPRDWNTGGNTLKFTSIAGTGVARIELSNGAGVRHGTNPGGTATNTINTPFVIAGPSVASGGDPTSGATGTNNSGISQNVGRIMNDGFAVINYTQGLTLEGALQTGAQGAARALDGNITLRGTAGGNPAYVGFHGRATGTSLVSNTNTGAATLQTPGQSGAGFNPLYIGVGRNDTLTIEDGAIGVMDLRTRTDQGNHNGVMLDAATVIHAGGKLQFLQSISTFTNSDTNVVSTASVGYHAVRNNIEGRGTTARESVVDLYLPFDNTITLNAGTVSDPLGGVEFQGTNVALIVNGAGLGGLRVNGVARPGVLIDGTPTGVDPVANDAKVANLLSPARLAALTGTGGYLTPAPNGATFAFPAAGQWAPAVNVGLRAVNSNTNGADVALPAGTWSHGLHVDAAAEMVVTGVTVSNGKVSGDGRLTSGAGASRLTIAAGATVAPGDGAALPGKLTSAGDVTFQAGSTLAVRVNGQAAGTGHSQLDAAGNAVALAGTLAITRDAAFNPTPYVKLAVLPYATRTGQFEAITGMDAGNNLLFATIYEADGVKLIPALPGDATVDRKVDFDDLVKLAQNYETVGGNTWSTGDFTGDGTVDFSDLVRLAQNYETSLPAAAVPGAPAHFPADLAAAFAAVPEPGSALALAVAGAVAASRRRRVR